MKLLFWGTYDIGKPRVRILQRGLRENGIEIIECHYNVWGGIEDKSQVSSMLTRIKILIKWILSYPLLLWKYFRSPKHDAIVISYLGQLDVVLIWPFAKLRGTPIIWDAFISLYNTVVEDRQLVGPKHPAAIFLYCWEWLACRAANVIILDTKSHAEYFKKKFHLSSNKKVEAVFVGAEPETFPCIENIQSVNSNKTVLFYGQFIPLHGIETIIHAARETENEAIDWVIIGKGQEERKIRKMFTEKPLKNIQWLPWVNYRELSDWIKKSNVCLGIFGETDKAERVIPNKVFQILMSGKPLITRDSPAVRELLTADMQGIKLIPAANPKALADAVREGFPTPTEPAFHSNVRQKILPVKIGQEFCTHIKNALSN